MTATLDSLFASACTAYEDLLKMVSERDLQRRSFPDDPAKSRIRDQLDVVLAAFTKVEEQMLETRQATEQAPVITLSADRRCFYREVVKKKWRLLIDARRGLAADPLDDLLVEAFFLRTTIRPELPRVRDTLSAAIESLTQCWDPGRLTELAERSLVPLEAEKLFFCDWFRPDLWLANEATLTPLLIEHAKRDTIPSDVTLRLREAFQCFIFGNHFAAVVMARSLVEALLNRFAPDFGISLQRPDKDGGTRDASLCELETDFARKIPRIRELVEPIRLAGNNVLHSRNGEKVRQSDALTPKQALNLLEKAVELAELLYARKTPNG